MRQCSFSFYPAAGAGFRALPSYLSAILAGLLLIAPLVHPRSAFARGGGGGGGGRQGNMGPVELEPDTDEPVGPDPRDLTLVAPYSEWTHHTTDAPHAVTVVHVFDAVGNLLRSGYGFTARCDGFVLVPGALFPADHDRMGEKSVVSFASADGETLTAALPTVRPPRFRSKRAPYVLIKVNSHHLPCLPMLDSTVVRKGMKVKIYVARPQKAPEAMAVAEKPLSGVIDSVTRDGRSFTVRQAAESDVAPVAPVAPADAAGSDSLTLPDGAVVTTEDGKASLGIVASDARSKSDIDYTPPAPGQITCASYAALYWVSNDIGLKVNLADVPGVDFSKIRGRDNAPPSEGKGMVRIPGGPVRLEGTYAGDFHDAYGIDFACCPEFHVDIDPVTVGPYRDWLISYRSLRQPERWVAEDELVKQRIPANMPIVSIWDIDAMDYANSHGKRMVTPVEWAKATLGPNMAWYTTYQLNLKRMQDFLNDLDVKKLAEYGRQMQNNSQQQSSRVGSISKSTTWVNSLQMLGYNLTERAAFREWFGRYGFADQTVTVERDPKDIGQYGVHHILANAPEMLQPNLGRGAGEKAWKPYAASVDPLVSQIVLEEKFRDIPMDGLDDTFITFFPPVGVRPRIKTIEGLGSTAGGYVYRAEGRSTFRCAR